MTKRKTKGGARVPVVYCGPTIPGVARQYTVFSGGQVPKALQEARERLPEIGGLILDLTELPKAMKQLRQGQGPVHNLYKSVQRKWR